MILKLRTQIKKTIEMLLPIEENKWIIYGNCKKDMQNYEMKHRIWFNPQEWKEYIDFITNKLQI